MTDPVTTFYRDVTDGQLTRSTDFVTAVLDVASGEWSAWQVDWSADSLTPLTQQAAQAMAPGVDLFAAVAA